MTPTLRTYWILPLVWLYEQIPAAEDELEDAGPIIGYYTTFGVTAESETEACELVSDAIHDGNIDWDGTDTSYIKPESLASAVVARSKDWTRKGIWYNGGRILFTPYDDQKATNNE
jgi:hypothetical protein